MVGEVGELKSLSAKCFWGGRWVLGGREKERREVSSHFFQMFGVELFVIKSLIFGFIRCQADAKKCPSRFPDGRLTGFCIDPKIKMLFFGC